VRLDVPVVIGAGPGGLAATRELERRGAGAHVLERSDSVCSSWRAHYDSLQLNSPRLMSSLPGAWIERAAGAWPPRERFVAYVERYAESLRSPIELGTEVRRVERDGEGWRLETSREPVWSRHVVVAAGLHAIPYLPPWPGRARFERELVHAASYRRADPYRGRDVLLVGMGQTGSDLGVDLLRGRVGRLRIAIRTPPIVMRRRMLLTIMSQLTKHWRVPDPVPDALARFAHRVMWSDLESLGLGLGESSAIATSGKGRSGTLAYERGFGFTFDRGLVDALRRGLAELVPAVERFEGPDVVLADGRRVAPDAVIAATGRRTNLPPLVGHLRGVLGPDGRPTVHAADTATGAPGLHFIGYRLPPAQLPDMRRDARAIARAVARTVTA
jgi:putative flavoprotein involved in K+ transport